MVGLLAVHGGHPVSADVIAHMSRDFGFCLQAACWTMAMPGVARQLLPGTLAEGRSALRSCHLSLAPEALLIGARRELLVVRLFLAIVPMLALLLASAVGIVPFQHQISPFKL